MPCLATLEDYRQPFMEDLDTPATGFDAEPSADVSGGSNKLILLALGVGVLGVLVGAAGIFLATQAAGELKAYKAEVAAAGNPLETELNQFRTEMKAKIDDIDGRLGNIGGSIVRLQRQGPSPEVAKQLQDMHAQTQEAFGKVSRDVQANRTQINEMNDRLEQLITRGGRAVASSSPASAPAQPAVPLEVPEGATVHTVQSGENLSVIARQYGLSLVRLMQANPTVEPKRMMPGDQIIIPAE